jgi:hypothetical protein
MSELSSHYTEGRPELLPSWTMRVSRKRFTRQDTVDFSDTEEWGNVYLNSFLQVRTRYQAVFGNEHSLHL